MQEKILQEIQQLKDAFTRLIGDDSAENGQSYSAEAISKAAKQFKQLSVERGEWVDDYHINKIIKSAPYNGTGAFIRTEFGFTNYFKKGRLHYYNRKALLALARELKERNVDLGRFMEYKADQAKFRESILTAVENNKGKKKAYTLPDDLRNIMSSPAKRPAVEAVRADIAALKEEFSRNNFGDYVDIYHDKYAMMKFIYPIQKYLTPGLKRQCKKWCDDFNYANRALELVTQG